ncbi:leucine-rich repeat domain-containing protein [Hugenholtzia roseola]|uniref:leucine-rich repeat domain-containing protein n=1 Tax=Hugenholtzia roseola TaxID=1002 RepID=UPI000427753A|nr:leucine-rich repeat domain-containing protein [Hugenholtzia roseola]
MRYRYPGTQPFSKDYAPLFFGRKEDAEKLYRSILLEKMVVLHSKSGMGKTSLLNAALVPKLEQQRQNKEQGQWQQVQIRFGGYVEGATPPLENTIKTIQNTFSTISFSTFGTDSLWECHKHLQNNQVEKVILIFDQFEELFDYPEQEIEQFKKQIAELFYTTLPQHIRQTLQELDQEGELSDEELEKWYSPFQVKAVFAIRSDKLSLLNRLSDKIPNILTNCYELAALSREQAKEAIVLPASYQESETPDSQSVAEQYFLAAPFSYTPEALQVMLDFLSNQGRERIESFQLQILCNSIEEKVIKEKIKVVTAEMLENLDNIFQNYYKHKIESITEGDTAAQNKLRILIEDKFIFEKEQRRVPLYQGQILSEISQELLKKLEQTRLIKVENSVAGTYMYELAHDTLVPPILKLKAERKVAEERAAYEVAQAQALREAREKAEQDRLKREKAKRQLRLVLVLLIISVGALFAALYAYYYAEKQKEEANKAIFRAVVASMQLKTDRELLDSADVNQIYYNNIEELYFPQYGLKHLPNEIGNLPFLRILECNENELEEISEHLWGLAKLEKLHLKGNEISEIPPMIYMLSSLRDLNLERNDIEKVPTELAQLKNLKKLDLRGNKISEIAPEFYQAPALEWLSLTGNRLEEIGAEIANLKSLRHLYLSENQLKILPESIGDLQNLETCEIHQNWDLKTIPDGFFNLKKLRYLKIESRLESLSPRLANLEALDTLVIYTDNSPIRLPDSLGNLKKLKFMMLLDCGLTELPKSVSGLEELSVLVISNSKIKELPDEMGKLSNLRKMTISGSELSLLPDSLYNLNSLVELHLPNNRLQSLDSKISELKGLEKLSLSHNQLTSLPIEIGKLKNLKYLDLRNNPIPLSEIAKIKKLLPNCDINHETLSEATTSQEGSGYSQERR